MYFQVERCSDGWGPYFQDIHLGLFRSDYLLHDPSIASSTPSLRGRGDQNGAGEISFKQVEFNTISSSFGALSAKVSGMHRCVVLIT